MKRRTLEQSRTNDWLKLIGMITKENEKYWFSDLADKDAHECVFVFVFSFLLVRDKAYVCAIFFLLTTYFKSFVYLQHLPNVCTFSILFIYHFQQLVIQ